eukprot:2891863-Rhodomonas_salina.1
MGYAYRRAKYLAVDLDSVAVDKGGAPADNLHARVTQHPLVDLAWEARHDVREGSGEGKQG